MKATVLFEGCGGSTAGLHAAGYETIGFEYWQPAVTCAQANGFNAHLHDLSDPTLDHLVPCAPLWWASPPCQPFSAAGQGEGEFDDRDGFPWLLRLVALRLPEVVIVENVKGLTFRKHSAYLCAVLEGFRALGYEVDWKVLMAADFGVPQTRERCIIICRRDGGPITWPAPTHCETGGMFTDKWVTMADALGCSHHLHQPANPVKPQSPLLSPGATSSQPNRRLYDPTAEPSPTVAFGNDVSSWCWTRPSTTVQCTDRIGAPGHHDPTVSNSQFKDAIKLTIPELAALQGFPPDWKWTGTKTQQARMVGNAVPPALAAAVASVNRPITLERAA